MTELEKRACDKFTEWLIAQQKADKLYEALSIIITDMRATEQNIPVEMVLLQDAVRRALMQQNP